MATLMIRPGSFSQVELRGLEPLTPCLQSMAKMSSTVHGLSRNAPRVHLSTASSRRFGVGCGCQPTQATRNRAITEGLWAVTPELTASAVGWAGLSHRCTLMPGAVIHLWPRVLLASAGRTRIPKPTSSGPGVRIVKKY